MGNIFTKSSVYINESNLSKHHRKRVNTDSEKSNFSRCKIQKKDYIECVLLNLSESYLCELPPEILVQIIMIITEETDNLVILKCLSSTCHLFREIIDNDKL